MDLNSPMLGLALGLPFRRASGLRFEEAEEGAVLNFYDSNIRTVRPPGLNSGATATQIVPGNNVKGAWIQLMPAIAEEGCYIEVDLQAVAVNAALRSCLVDIGIDTGSGPVVRVQDLVGTAAGFTNAGWGIGPYTFRLQIPAGASIHGRASVNNATVGQARAVVRIKGKASSPMRAGNLVRAYGVVAATSSGFPIAAADIGQAANGPWKQLGTVGAGENPFQWQLGVSFDNAAIAAASGYRFELAIGDSSSTDVAGTKQTVAEVWGSTLTTEQVWYVQSAIGSVRPSVPGDKLWVRGWCSAVPENGVSVVGYAADGNVTVGIG